MSLFNSMEIKIDKIHFKKGEGIIDTGSENAVFIGSSKEFGNILDLLPSAGTVHYATNGAFSAHDLLFSLIETMHVPKVYLSTWTMTEFPAKRLIDAMNCGLIKELNCLLDVRMEKNPNVLQLMKFNASRIRLTNCHAKVMVIMNDYAQYTVVSSQNMTENPRMEAGVISQNRNVAEFHVNWMEKLMNDADEAQ